MSILLPLPLSISDAISPNTPSDVLLAGFFYHPVEIAKNPNLSQPAFVTILDWMAACKANFTQRELRREVCLALLENPALPLFLVDHPDDRTKINIEYRLAFDDFQDAYGQRHASDRGSIQRAFMSHLKAHQQTTLKELDESDQYIYGTILRICARVWRRKTLGESKTFRIPVHYDDIADVITFQDAHLSRIYRRVIPVVYHIEWLRYAEHDLGASFRALFVKEGDGNMTEYECLEGLRDALCTLQLRRIHSISRTPENAKEYTRAMTALFREQATIIRSIQKA